MFRFTLLSFVLIGPSTLLALEPAGSSQDKQLSGQWPQAAGPAGNFLSRASDVPLEWSVVRNQNIRWRKTLSETGQSTVVVWRDRIFFTTLVDVDQDAELGQNIVAYCCDKRTGKTLWERSIVADHPLRLSGCFSDSSAPPPVTDGKHVCFFNASGMITCFDFDGNLQWSRKLMPVGRSQPFLVGGNVVFIRQTYMPDEKGHFCAYDSRGDLHRRMTRSSRYVACH